MNLQTILSWVGNLKLVPQGYLTKGAGWLGIITALACLAGHPIPFLPCADDPATALTVGLAAVGLGRRS